MQRVVDPLIDAMKEARIVLIWDLCHYGFPDDLDPFTDAFTERFAAYCKAAASYVHGKLEGPCFFTPINEITFFAFCGGEWGWVAPFKTTREDCFRFRLAHCKAKIR